MSVTNSAISRKRIINPLMKKIQLIHILGHTPSSIIIFSQILHAFFLKKTVKQSHNIPIEA
jgi:hypothetical protein